MRVLGAVLVSLFFWLVVARLLMRR